MPKDDDPDELVAVNLRLPRSLVARIDQRAGRHKLSRNRWATLALDRVVDLPTQVGRAQGPKF